jgi:hypothetical protein
MILLFKKLFFMYVNYFLCNKPTFNIQLKSTIIYNKTKYINTSRKLQHTL